MVGTVVAAALCLGEAGEASASHSIGLPFGVRQRVSTVAQALEAHREDIERGALLSIDQGGTRVRMLPLKGPPS